MKFSYFLNFSVIKYVVHTVCCFYLPKNLLEWIWFKKFIIYNLDIPAFLFLQCLWNLDGFHSNRDCPQPMKKSLKSFCQNNNFCQPWGIFDPCNSVYADEKSFKWHAHHTSLYFNLGSKKKIIQHQFKKPCWSNVIISFIEKCIIWKSKMLTVM